MALLELDPDAAAALIADYPDVTLAVYASPRQTVIAGPPEQVDARDRGGRARRTGWRGASRSMWPPITRPSIRYCPSCAPRLPDLTPQPRRRSRSSPPPATRPRRGAIVFDADYWAANLRNPVRFSQAVAAAGADHATFVEVSPHPLLTYAISDTLGRAHHHSIATLQRDTDDTLTFHTNLNTTHTTHPPRTRTPRDHIRCCPPPRGTTHSTGSPSRSGCTREDLRPDPALLLGEHIAVATTPPAHLWQARLVPEGKPYPGFHRIHGVEVVPISVLLQTLSAAAAECGASTLSDVRFERPIVVDQPQVIQVVADDESVTVSSAPAVDTPAHRWVRHVSARISHRLEGYEPEGTDNMR